MVETLNFKKGVTVMKLYTTITNLNVWGIKISRCSLMVFDNRVLRIF
jgi:hypothetical protein